MRATTCFAIGLALVAAGCQSSPRPVQQVANPPAFQPAPGGETQVAAPSSTMPIEIEVVPENMTFGRSDSFGHSWKGTSGRTFRVAFDLSFRFEKGTEEIVGASVADNFDAALAVAQAICEQFDLRNQQSVVACEDILCEQLSGALFPAGEARVERVIWSRMMWQ